MPSLVDARETIYQRWATQWGATTPYTFANEAYDPPVNTAWVSFGVVHTASTLEAIGGSGYGGMNLFQRQGLCNMRIFVPQDQGIRAADTLAQQARGIWEGVTLASNAIRFTNVDIREIGPVDSWFVIEVDATFQYDERK